MNESDGYIFDFLANRGKINACFYVLLIRPEGLIISIAATVPAQQKRPAGLTKGVFRIIIDFVFTLIIWNSHTFLHKNI